jgi:hypothetical protein
MMNDRRTRQRRAARRRKARDVRMGNLLGTDPIDWVIVWGAVSCILLAAILFMAFP